MARLFVTIAVLAVISTAHTNALAQSYTDDYVKAGDYVQIILPAGAFATTLVLRDWEGSKQFLLGGGVTLAIVHATKYLSERLRPDESTYNSFPSGHTAAAFYGPAFIHRRYGWKYAAWIYPFAMFVGYSRVHANRHWEDDVFTGAALSLISNWAFTKPYAKNVKIEPEVSGDYRGLRLEINF